MQEERGRGRGVARRWWWIGGVVAVAVIVAAVVRLGGPEAPTTEVAGPSPSSPAPVPTPPASTTAVPDTPDARSTSEREPVVAATPTATSRPTTPPTPDPPRVAMVVGDAGSLNHSERLLRNHLRTRGYVITVADDDDSTTPESGKDLILISKTVESTAVTDRYAETAAGVMTWEDNAQAIEQGGAVDEQGTGTPMLSWIDLLNPDDTAWHAPDQTWHLDPEAPAELRAGMSGSTRIYTSTSETTYAPAGALPDAATVVASIEEGDPRVTYYVYEQGAPLADGTPSPGRRVYFGLYDDTFAQLTPDGLALFDAAIRWGAAG